MAWEGFSGPASGVRIVDLHDAGSQESPTSPVQNTPTNNPSSFPSDEEMKRFGRLFVTERINSLKKDVSHCLETPYAPFPAILYSIATIEMLGALTKGQASKNAPTSPNTEAYMMTFMHYTEEQTDLIMQIFRHKLSHLAQPKPIMTISGKTIAWQYHHDDKMLHLLLTPADKNSVVLVTSNWPKIQVELVFHLSIRQLLEDIEYSVWGHNGFLDKLERNEDNLFDNFKIAVGQIYGVRL